MSFSRPRSLGVFRHGEWPSGRSVEAHWARQHDHPHDRRTRQLYARRPGRLLDSQRYKDATVLLDVPLCVCIYVRACVRARVCVCIMYV